jgi:uncharacterized membrane protein YfbV (UPF0208 family)
MKNKNKYVRVKDRKIPRFFELGQNGSSIDYINSKPAYKKATQIIPRFEDINSNTPAKGSTTDRAFGRKAASSSFQRTEAKAPRFFSLAQTGSSVDYVDPKPAYKKAAKVIPHFEDIKSNTPVKGSTTDRAFGRKAASSSFQRTEAKAPRFFSLAQTGSSVDYVNPKPAYKKAAQIIPRFEDIITNTPAKGSTTERQPKPVARASKAAMPSFVQMAEKADQAKSETMAKKKQRNTSKV